MSSVAERVQQIMEDLPIEKQAEVLDFVELLRARIQRNGEPSHPARRLGTMAGRFTVPDDFDDPLPPEIQRYFEGEDDGVLGKPG